MQSKVSFKNGEYLTASKLGEMLEEVFPEKVEKEVKFGKYKVDYLLDCKIAIEFDGFRHYSETMTYFRDLELDSACNLAGVTVIRIPYFLQYWVIFNHFFDINYQPQAEILYPLGFVDKKALRPKDFCVFGWKRFLSELESYPFSKEIIQTFDDMDIKAFEIMAKAF